MKFTKAPVLLFSFILMLLSVNAYSQNGGYATMRVFDCNKSVSMGTGFISAKIIIVYEDGKSEEVELLPYNEKNALENLKRITATLNALKAKGYFLISQDTSGEQGAILSDYTFLKQ